MKQEAARALLEELGVQHASGILWPTPAVKSRVYAFANEHGGLSLNPSNSCPACDIQAVEAVRKAAGMVPLNKEATARMILSRKRACQGADGMTSVKADPCPAYHAATDSCGRLIVDAIPLVRDQVEVDGRMVQPCGCRLFGVWGKARMEDQKCPAGKW